MNLQLSVPITTNVVSLNPSHGKVYLIQHYVIKSVNDLLQVGGFLRTLRFTPSIKLTDTIFKEYVQSGLWNKEYHTVRTVTKSNRKPKNTTLSEQLLNLIDKQRIPHCQNSYKI